ncbi:MAG: ATP synthase subunit I [Polyangiales bacterium]
MSETAEETPDRTIQVVTVAIGACALLLAGASLIVVGAKFAFAVVVGGAIGVANFLLLARIGKAVTGSSSGAAFWGGVYFFKIAALFGGLYLLFHTGAVNLYGLLVGLSALAPGIVVGGVLATPKAPPAAKR